MTDDGPRHEKSAARQADDLDDGFRDDPVTPILDASTRRRLVELRALLREAQARTGDGSFVGRHAALILLDGACEFALRLSAGALGLHRPADKFHGTYRKVAEKVGPVWTAPGWKGVDDLHDTRNSAQHRGVRVDGEELSRWAADAEAFIASLVSATFGVSLRDVTVAEAVRTDELRDCLLRAEHALASDEPDDALDGALGAFESARAMWTNQRGRAESFRSGSTPREDFTADYVKRAIAHIQEYSDIGVFAPDLGEYFLLRNLALNRHLAPPSMDEARRAVVFVSTWILRWEAFSARYPGQRTRPEPEPPPRTDSSDPRPHIVDAGVGGAYRDLGGEKLAYRGWLQVADLPEGREVAWLEALRRAFRDALEVRPVAESSGRLRPLPAVDGSARVEVHGLTDEEELRALITEVKDAIKRADMLFEEAEQRSQEWRAREPGERERYDQALEDVRFLNQPLFGPVELFPTGERDQGGHLRFSGRVRPTVNDHLRSVEFVQAFDGAVRSRSLSGMRYLGGDLSFSDLTPPDELVAIGRLAASDVEARIKARQVSEEKEGARRHSLEQSLRRIVSEEVTPRPYSR